MNLKKLAGIAFAISFLMALRLFADVGPEYITLKAARTIFLISGALALLFNLLSFQHGKHNLIFNFLYWAGSIVLFAGLAFYLFHLPYASNIIIIGLVIVGLSFVLPDSLLERKEKNTDLLDDND
ncbi:MAG: hypothetical protein QNK23_03685 [Crocinitomicaceae bacterium]|nr:hypothetical protein [Crocinitomicaceae bacterium]